MINQSSFIHESVVEARQFPIEHVPTIVTPSATLGLIPTSQSTQPLDEKGVDLFVAISQGRKDVVELELSSPSWAYKQLCGKAIVSLESDDDLLIKLVQSSSIKLQRILLKKMIVQKRTSALDQLIPWAKSHSKGLEMLLTFLHGCSGEIIRQILETDPQVLRHPLLNRLSLCTFHGMSVVVPLIERDLLEETQTFSNYKGLVHVGNANLRPEDRDLKEVVLATKRVQKVWASWKEWTESGSAGKICWNRFLSSHGVIPALFTLATRFPCFETDSVHSDLFAQNFLFPQVLEESFLAHCFPEVCDLYISYLRWHEDVNHMTGVPLNKLKHFFAQDRVDFQPKLKLADHLFSYSEPQSYDSSFLAPLFTSQSSLINIVSTIRPHQSDMLTILLKKILDWLVQSQPDCAQFISPITVCPLLRRQIEVKSNSLIKELSNKTLLVHKSKHVIEERVSSFPVDCLVRVTSVSQIDDKKTPVHRLSPHWALERGHQSSVVLKRELLGLSSASLRRNWTARLQSFASCLPQLETKFQSRSITRSFHDHLFYQLLPLLPMLSPPVPQHIDDAIQIAASLSSKLTILASLFTKASTDARPKPSLLCEMVSISSLLTSPHPYSATSLQSLFGRIEEFCSRLISSLSTAIQSNDPYLASATARVSSLQFTMTEFSQLTLKLRCLFVNMITVHFREMRESAKDNILKSFLPIFSKHVFQSIPGVDDPNWEDLKSLIQFSNHKSAEIKSIFGTFVEDTRDLSLEERQSLLMEEGDTSRVVDRLLPGLKEEVANLQNFDLLSVGRNINLVGRLTGNIFPGIVTDYVPGASLRINCSDFVLFINLSTKTATSSSANSSNSADTTESTFTLDSKATDTKDLLQSILISLNTSRVKYSEYFCLELPRNESLLFLLRTSIDHAPLYEDTTSNSSLIFRLFEESPNLPPFLKSKEKELLSPETYVLPWQRFQLQTHFEITVHQLEWFTQLHQISPFPVDFTHSFLEKVIHQFVSLISSAKKCFGFSAEIKFLNHFMRQNFQEIQRILILSKKSFNLPSQIFSLSLTLQTDPLSFLISESLQLLTSINLFQSNAMSSREYLLERLKYFSAFLTQIEAKILELLGPASLSADIIDHFQSLPISNETKFARFSLGLNYIYKHTRGIGIFSHLSNIQPPNQLTSPAESCFSLQGDHPLAKFLYSLRTHTINILNDIIVSNFNWSTSELDKLLTATSTCPMFLPQVLTAINSNVMDLLNDSLSFFPLPENTAWNSQILISIRDDIVGRWLTFFSHLHSSWRQLFLPWIAQVQAKQDLNFILANVAGAQTEIDGGKSKDETDNKSFLFHYVSESIFAQLGEFVFSHTDSSALFNPTSISEIQFFDSFRLSPSTLPSLRSALPILQPRMQFIDSTHAPLTTSTLEESRRLEGKEGVLKKFRRSLMKFLIQYSPSTAEQVISLLTDSFVDLGYQNSFDWLRELSNFLVESNQFEPNSYLALYRRLTTGFISFTLTPSTSSPITFDQLSQVLGLLRNHLQTLMSTRAERDFSLRTGWTSEPFETEVRLILLEFIDNPVVLECFLRISLDSMIDSIQLCTRMNPSSFTQSRNALFLLPSQCRDHLTSILLFLFRQESKDFVSPAILDQLKAYLDIRQKPLRKLIEKQADSHSIEERLAAFQNLISSTALLPRECQVQEWLYSLKFLSVKTKNEICTNRASILQVLTDNIESLFDCLAEQILTAEEFPSIASDILALLLKFLQDALEIPDLDDEAESENIQKSIESALSHPILNYFVIWSVFALNLSAKCAKLSLFLEFGAEIQWKIVLFRSGERDATNQFVMYFGNNTSKLQSIGSNFLKKSNRAFFPSRNSFDSFKTQSNILPLAPESEEQFLQSIITTYRKKLLPLDSDVEPSDSFLSWLDPIGSHRLVSLFELFGTRSLLLPTMQTQISKLSSLLEKTRNTSHIEADSNDADNFVGLEEENEAPSQLVTVRLSNTVVADCDVSLNLGLGTYFPMDRTISGRPVYQNEQLTSLDQEPIRTKYLVFSSEKKMWLIMTTLEFPVNMSHVIAMSEELPEQDHTLFPSSQLKWEVISNPESNISVEYHDFSFARDFALTLDEASFKVLDALLSNLKTPKEGESGWMKHNLIKQLALASGHTLLHFIHLGLGSRFSKIQEFLLRIWSQFFKTYSSKIVNNTYSIYSNLTSPLADPFFALFCEMIRFVPRSKLPNNVLPHIPPNDILEFLPLFTQIHNLLEFQVYELSSVLPSKSGTARSLEILPNSSERSSLNPSDLQQSCFFNFEQSPYWLPFFDAIVDRLSGSRTEVIFILSSRFENTCFNLLYDEMKSMSFHWWRFSPLVRMGSILLDHLNRLPQQFDGTLLLPEGAIYPRPGIAANKPKVHFFPVVKFFESVLKCHCDPFATHGFKSSVSKQTKHFPSRFGHSLIHKPSWDSEKVPLISRYFSMMLKTSSPAFVLFRWLQFNTLYQPNRKSYQVARNSLVEQLLQISKSSLHLRFVKKHLLSFRNDLLKDALAEFSPTSSSPKLLTGPYFRPRSIPLLPPPTPSPPTRGRRPPPPSKTTVAKVETSLPTDKVISLDLLVSIPQLNSLQKNFQTELKEFKTRSTEGLFSVNYQNMLLQGLLYDHEKLVPLNVLLQPKFLSTDQARIVAQVLPSCAPYFPEGGIFEVLKLLLSGERRKALKLTVHKEILRMLSRDGTEASYVVLRREWDREDLHRDLRIVQIESAFKIIASSSTKTFMNSFAWHVLTTAATLPHIAVQPEVLLALLCPDFDSEDVLTDWQSVAKSVCFKPRIEAHLSIPGKLPLDKTIRAQYLETVLIPLSQRFTTFEELKTAFEQAELSKKQQQSEKKTTGTKNRSTPSDPKQTSSSTNDQTAADQQSRTERNLAKFNLALQSFDHVDLWDPSLIFQTRRLPSEYLHLIELFYLKRAFNKNVGVPERSKSLVRWTLLPTTSHLDILDLLKFIEPPPPPPKETEQKQLKPTNKIESSAEIIPLETLSVPPPSDVPMEEAIDEGEFLGAERSDDDVAALATLSLIRFFERGEVQRHLVLPPLMSLLLDLRPSLIGAPNKEIQDKREKLFYHGLALLDKEKLFDELATIFETIHRRFTALLSRLDQSAKLQRETLYSRLERISDYCPSPASFITSKKSSAYSFVSPSPSTTSSDSYFSLLVRFHQIDIKHSNGLRTFPCLSKASSFLLQSSSEQSNWFLQQILSSYPLADISLTSWSCTLNQLSPLLSLCSSLVLTSDISIASRLDSCAFLFQLYLLWSSCSFPREALTFPETELNLFPGQFFPFMDHLVSLIASSNLNQHIQSPALPDFTTLNDRFCQVVTSIFKRAESSRSSKSKSHAVPLRILETNVHQFLNFLSNRMDLGSPQCESDLKFEISSIWRSLSMNIFLNSQFQPIATTHAFSPLVTLVQRMIPILVFPQSQSFMLTALGEKNPEVQSQCSTLLRNSTLPFQQLSSLLKYLFDRPSSSHVLPLIDFILVTSLPSEIRPELPPTSESLTELCLQLKCSSILSHFLSSSTFLRFLRTWDPLPYLTKLSSLSIYSDIVLRFEQSSASNPLLPLILTQESLNSKTVLDVVQHICFRNFDTQQGFSTQPLFTSIFGNFPETQIQDSSFLRGVATFSFLKHSSSLGLSLPHSKSFPATLRLPSNNLWTSLQLGSPHQLCGILASFDLSMSVLTSSTFAPFLYSQMDENQLLFLLQTLFSLIVSLSLPIDPVETPSPSTQSGGISLVLDITENLFQAALTHLKVKSTPPSVKKQKGSSISLTSDESLDDCDYVQVSKDEFSDDIRTQLENTHLDESASTAASHQDSSSNIWLPKGLVMFRQFIISLILFSSTFSEDPAADLNKYLTFSLNSAPLPASSFPFLRFEILNQLLQRSSLLHSCVPDFLPRIISSFESLQFTDFNSPKQEGNASDFLQSGSLKFTNSSFIAKTLNAAVQLLPSSSSSSSLTEIGRRQLKTETDRSLSLYFNRILRPSHSSTSQTSFQILKSSAEQMVRHLWSQSPATVLDFLDSNSTYSILDLMAHWLPLSGASQTLDDDLISWTLSESSGLYSGWVKLLSEETRSTHLEKISTVLRAVFSAGMESSLRSHPSNPTLIESFCFKLFKSKVSELLNGTKVFSIQEDSPAPQTLSTSNDSRSTRPLPLELMVHCLIRHNHSSFLSYPSSNKVSTLYKSLTELDDREQRRTIRNSPSRPTTLFKDSNFRFLMICSQLVLGKPVSFPPASEFQLCLSDRINLAKACLLPLASQNSKSVIQALVSYFQKNGQFDSCLMLSRSLMFAASLTNSTSVAPFLSSLLQDQIIAYLDEIAAAKRAELSSSSEQPTVAMLNLAANEEVISRVPDLLRTIVQSLRSQTSIETSSLAQELSVLGNLSSFSAVTRSVCFMITNFVGNKYLISSNSDSSKKQGVGEMVWIPSVLQLFLEIQKNVFDLN